MAKSFLLTLNPLVAATDPNAVLATPLNVLDETFRFDDSGNATGDFRNLDLYNVHTVIIPPGDSSNDTLRGTTGNDLVFWDYQSLSLLSVSLSLLGRQGLPNANQDNVIERFDLGDGNDLINLTYNAGGLLIPSPGPYTWNATIYGGEGNDVVWSGAGSDSIFGDNGNDALFGGAGNDTVYGGAGADSLIGGTGDDMLYGAGSALVDGGAGADIVQVAGTGASYVLSTLVGGPNDGSDGIDLVTTTGVYQQITSSLGGGADQFIGSSSAGGAESDLVLGQDGNDLIATNAGADTIYGGANDDVLWGGAGSDTIFGDDGNDIIYMGAGGANISYGGAGIDVWYVFRTEGAANQIYDLYRETGSGDADEAAQSGIIVGGDQALNELGGDYLQNGTGVKEADHDIMDNSGGDDMVWVHQISGNLYQLDVVGGAGTLGMTVQFDVRDVPNILLWNSDAAPDQESQELYTWNGSQYVYWSG